MTDRRENSEFYYDQDIVEGAVPIPLHTSIHAYHADKYLLSISFILIFLSVRLQIQTMIKRNHITILKKDSIFF